MKKFLLPGILAVFAFFLPSRSQAVPIDVPYQIIVSTIATGSVILSTANFPSGNSTWNSNVALGQWCLTSVAISVPGMASSTFNMAYATTTLVALTTDYTVTTSTNVQPVFLSNWDYRTPYCSPVGQAILKLTDSVAGATLAIQGFFWRGWNQ